MNLATNYSSSLWCSELEMRWYQKRHALAAAQGAGGEAAEDEDQHMVCEDGHFIPLVGGLLLHLDEDLVERGWRWKRQRCRLNQSRSTCGDVLVSSLMIRWKLDSYSDEIRGK